MRTYAQKQSDKRYYSKNQELRQAACREWKEKNKERIREYMRAYRENKKNQT
jgi:hypothetical protein